MLSLRFKNRLTRILIKRRLKPLIMGAVVLLIIIEIVVLSPASVDEGGGKSVAVDPETLLNDEEATLATGIPRGKIPEYSVDQFQYVSTQGTEKQWKLIADKSFLYSQEQLMHARQIRAFLYDPDGKITIVTGKEAKYFTGSGKRDLEVFGDVHTIFPDGFELNSEYLRYRPDQKKIEIPVKYVVHGDGHEKEGQNLTFISNGMDFAMLTSVITLPKNVTVTMEKIPDPSPSPRPSSAPDRTVIVSDHAIIYRLKQVANFTMYPNRPLDTRFVHITQPTMFTRSRRAVLNYGDSAKLLQYMTVYDDVLVKETGKKDVDDTTLRYATGGRADFDNLSDIIRITEFPQAYQDNDTVTGDIILLHRDTDLVEVEHSNAFSQGTSP